MLMNATVVIANRINDFIDDWQDGDCYCLTIPIDDLFLDVGNDLENNIEEALSNVEIVEAFEIECGELVLELNYFILQRNFNARMAEWKLEKELQNEEYYRSVI